MLVRFVFLGLSILVALTVPRLSNRKELENGGGKPIGIEPARPPARSLVRSLARSQVGVWQQDLAADNRRRESLKSADVAGGQSASSSSTIDSEALQSKDNLIPQASQAGGSGQCETTEAETKSGQCKSLVSKHHHHQQQKQQQPRFARIVVTCEMLRSVLGPGLYESEVAARVAVPGMCTGLAWTPTGGELLFIECASMPGCGNVKLTGKLGEVRDDGYVRYR